MDPDELAVLRKESDAVYVALDRALRSRRGDGTWAPAQVYGHLARWLAVSAAKLTRHRQGLPESEEDEDEDTLNDRWAAEDAALSPEEARARCDAARTALFTLLEVVPTGEWTETVDRIARDDTVDHPRAHLESITDGAGGAG